MIWRALLVPAAVAFAACSSAVAADTVNSIRQAHGLKPLQQSGAMQTMAQRCASSMAARNSLDHAGFFSERAPAGARAENVAFGCATQSCTIGVWSRSAGHRANMLNRAVRSYLRSGVGCRRRPPLLVHGAGLSGAASPGAANNTGGVAPSQSITSSASVSNVGGTAMPSALAVFKLSTKSNLVGSTTGSSPGLSPLRIRATYTPIWR